MIVGRNIIGQIIVGQVILNQMSDARLTLSQRYPHIGLAKLLAPSRNPYIKPTLEGDKLNWRII